MNLDLHSVQGALAHITPAPGSGSVLYGSVRLREAADTLRTALEAKPHIQDLSQENAAAWALLEKAGAPTDTDIGDLERGVKLLRIVEAFVAEHGIACADTIYQTDRVIRGAYEFIEKLVEVCGYAELDDE